MKKEVTTKKINTKQTCGSNGPVMSFMIEIHINNFWLKKAYVFIFDINQRWRRRSRNLKFQFHQLMKGFLIK